MGRSAHAARGFTLIEAVIVLAIMALATAVVIPAVSNITRAELRATASKLAGLIRQTYDQAALSSLTHRLVFDFESKSIAVETTEQVLAFEPGSNVLAEAAQAHAELNELTRLPPEMQSMFETEDSGDSDEEMGGLSALTAMLAISDLGGSGGMTTDGEAFSSGEGGGGGLKLDDDVGLLDVWVQGMGEAASEGKVYLYFFPHGYSQDAVVNLEDKDGSVFSVRVSALTGRTKISSEYVEVPK